ncbi:MAG: 50S ribosomal protein L18 [candidate division Zixibacteria bacterium]|jgi:large subunit ribosomal protein L18|nr:50S ribosomal protein L18 [candidate division Zixibacteria bacterium]
MNAHDIKKRRAAKKKARVRGKIHGTAERPRLAVSKTIKNISVQIIDDEKMVTLAVASSLVKEIAEKADKKTKTAVAEMVGKAIAEKALAKGIKKVAFDRNRNLYHGRIKALAEAARKAGLEF